MASVGSLNETDDDEDRDEADVKNTDMRERKKNK